MSYTGWLALGLALLVSPRGAAADALDEAREAWKADRLQEALERITPLAEASPDDADTIGLRGRIYFDLGRFDESLVDMERAKELDAEVWGELASSMACRVAFFFADDAKARALLPTFEPGAVTQALPYLLDPPGLERFQLKKGRYVIYADATLRETKGEVFTARMMELIYDAYSSVFPFDVDERLISRVYVFGKTSTYLRFSQDAFGTDKSNAAGYYSPSTRVLVVNADPDGARPNDFGFTADAINTLFHEGFHQFVRFHIPQGVPDWFNEGLAEYFGPSVQSGRKKLKVGVVVKNDANFVTRYERIHGTLRDHPGSVWSVARFMRQTDEEFDFDGRRSLNYAQSWSIVHFLIDGMGKQGRKLVKSYFEVLKRGGTPDEAFRVSFGSLNLERFDKAWRAYVLEKL